MVNMSDAVAAFGEEHASKLTGISMSQLRYWDRTDFYSPSYAEANRRLPFSRVYSFKDIHRLQLACLEPNAAKRVKEALSLIEEEWRLNDGTRPMVIELREHSMIIFR